MRVALAVVVAAASLAACSSRVGEVEFLPWFKKREETLAFGSFAAHRETKFLARHLGVFWLEVDAEAAVPVSDDVVLLRSARGTSFLRRGAFSPVLACGQHDEAGVPPGPLVVDCIVNDPTRPNSWAERLEVRRKSLDGETISSQLLDVGDGEHVFRHGSPFFYDPDGNVYAVAIRKGALTSRSDASDCVLVTRDGAATRVVARRPELSDWFPECLKPSAWSGVAGVALVANDSRTWQTLPRRIGAR